MLTPGARPARWLACLAALITAIALPVMEASPASADQARQRQQWVLAALRVPEAWHVTQGRGVTVAVIDSGVDPSVSDLTGSVRSGPDFTGVHTSPNNPNWGAHGTWMASLIAGHGHGSGNRSGIMGVAPQARILSIRVITDRSDPGYKAYQHEPASRGQRELARAIRYAVNRGVQVISMSLGYDGASVAVRSALQDALAHNVVVVASSGNAGTAARAGQGSAPYSFPADYPGVIGVAAVAQSGRPAYFSSENLSVQVAAPGVNVPAQGRGSKYWVVSGTSPACALTAGVAALIKSRYGKLTAAQIRGAITGSSSHRPQGGYDPHVGFGTVDAAAALNLAAKLAKQIPAGQTQPGKAAAAGLFGNGEGGVGAFPVPPRGREKLLVFGGVAAGGLLLLLVAALLIVSGRRKRRAARPIGVTATQGPPGPVGPGFVARPGGLSAADLDARYPTQIYPAQPQRPGLPVQGFISQPGQGPPAGGFPGQAQSQAVAGPPPQLQIGSGQYSQPIAGQPVPGQPGPEQFGQHGPPGQGATGAPPFQAGPGHPGQTIPPPGYGPQGYAGPAQPGQWHPGQGFPPPGPYQPDPGYGTPPAFPPAEYPGGTGLPGATSIPATGQPDLSQPESSQPEWPFEEEQSGHETGAVLPPADTDQVPMAAPARDEGDSRSGQDHQTVLPPGRTLLPEPDRGGLLDEDPLTSPRYAWDGRAERALRPGGYRSDWLSSRHGVTRPMSSPPRLSAQQPSAAADPDAPGQTPQSARPMPGALPKRARQPAEAGQAAEPDQPERANGVRAAPDPQAAPQAEDGHADLVQPDSGPRPSVPAQAAPPDAGPAGPAASAIRRPVLPTRTPAMPPTPAASRSGEADEGTRSVWEPLARNRSTPAAGLASDETMMHLQPSVQAGPSAWESRLSRQSQQTGGEPPGPQPGPRSGALPRREPPAPGDQQAQTGQLPRRQPMTHLAAPLRRDRQSAGRDQQAGDGRPVQSVWDTWRPAASVQRSAQQDAPDSGDDQA